MTPEERKGRGMRMSMSKNDQLLTCKYRNTLRRRQATPLNTLLLKCPQLLLYYINYTILLLIKIKKKKEKFRKM